MKQYIELLQHILNKGKRRQDRTGVGTIGVFGPQIEMDMNDGFPLLTTKKVHTKSILYELLWFLRGDTNIKWLQDHGVTIWNEWADANGDLGPVYGAQWVRWMGAKQNDKFPQVWHTDEPVNQIANLVRDLKANPYSRRHIVSAWNVNQVNHMKLPPCHTLWQCHVEDSLEMKKMRESDDYPTVATPIKILNLKLYARSIDTFLGLPFNIASYAFLLHMLAHVCSMRPGKLIISFGDVHIYLNHCLQVAEQLTRQPKTLPKLSFNRSVGSIFDFQFEDFNIEGYDPHPAIKAPVAV